jgi:carboxylesterase type B
MIRALMSSPKAKNLFKRAIIESDPQMYPLENRTISRDTVGAYALSLLGCSNVACARGKSAADIVAATSQVQAVGPSLNPDAVPAAALSPTIDGTFVRGDFSDLISTGSLPMEVDVLLGTSNPSASLTVRNGIE